MACTVAVEEAVVEHYNRFANCRPNTAHFAPKDIVEYTQFLQVTQHTQTQLPSLDYLFIVQSVERVDC